MNALPGQPSEAVARQNSAKRTKNGDTDSGAPCEDVLKDEVTGQDQEEFVRNRQTDDSQNQRREDPEITVLPNPAGK